MKALLIKFAKYIFGKRNSGSLSVWIILLCDIFCVILSTIFTIFIKYFPDFSSITFSETILRTTTVIIFFTIAFLASGSYKGLIRYTGFQDIEKISKTVLCTFICLYLVKFTANSIPPLKFIGNYFPSLTNTFIICITTLVLLVIFRLVVRRVYNEFFRPHPKTINAVIYGAGDSGPITQSALMHDTSTQYNIVSFVDDSVAKTGKSINGVAIRKPSEVLNKEFIKKHNINAVILSIPSLTIQQKQELINRLMDLDVAIKSVPHVSAWIDGKGLSANQIEDIKIEDLLEREPIVLDRENIRNQIGGKVVLVTGAAGSIGSEICRQVLLHSPKGLILLDQAESPIYDLQYELNNSEPYKHIAVPKEFVIANVKDINKMAEVFDKYRPQIVYHAAAYKHVPLMESFPYEAVSVNVFGTKNMADLSMKYGVEKFVMISTDKAVNPTNVMGATKRIAEIYTQSRNSATQFITTRFGNVLGSNGSVIPLFKKQLEQGGPLTVTDRNIIRYFMTIPEACSLVLEASALGEGGDIFVFDMGEPVKIYDLASKMIKLSGMTNVQIEITGLRPGEKLYEELLATKENTIPTEHPKIMRAQVRRYAEEEVNEEINILNGVLPTCDNFKIVGQMKKIVPEFKSNNSVFQILDIKDMEQK